MTWNADYDSGGGGGGGVGGAAAVFWNKRCNEDLSDTWYASYGIHDTRTLTFNWITLLIINMMQERQINISWKTYAGERWRKQNG